MYFGQTGPLYRHASGQYHYIQFPNPVLPTSHVQTIRPDLLSCCPRTILDRPAEHVEHVVWKNFRILRATAIASPSCLGLFGPLHLLSNSLLCSHSSTPVDFPRESFPRNSLGNSPPGDLSAQPSEVPRIASLGFGKPPTTLVVFPASIQRSVVISITQKWRVSPNSLYLSD